MSAEPTFGIKTAGLRDLDALVELFEGYRAFYRCAADLEGARRFLLERIDRAESVIFIARDRERRQALGFVQMFPMFSTLRLTRTWILEDLFVAPTARTGGIGSALLARAEAFAKASGAGALSLTTAHDNHAAQRLYARAGWERDDVFVTYHRELAIRRPS